MSDTMDNRPYWQKPVPPIKYPALDSDPLADNGGVTLTEESLQNFAASQTNGAASSDIPSTDSTSEPDPLADLPPETDKIAAPADVQRGTSASPQASSVLSVPEAQRLLTESHLRMAVATDRQKTARSNVAHALAVFQRLTLQTQDFESLVREHIASSNQERADRVAGRGPVRPQRRLGSAIDSFAFHTKNAGRSAGGGAAFRRGARAAAGRSMLGGAPTAFPGSGLPQIKEK